MEPRDHGVDHQADIRPGEGEPSQIMPFSRQSGACARRLAVVGEMAERSSANSATRHATETVMKGPTTSTHENIAKRTPTGC